MPSPILLDSPSHPHFARLLSNALTLKAWPIERKPYSDGECYIRITAPPSRVAGAHAIVVASGHAPAHDHALELMLITDALKRMRPKRITAVIPFLPYRRQEHIHVPGEGIGGELMMRLFKTAGVTDCLTADLHHHSFKIFFGSRLREISALPLFTEYFKPLAHNCVVVSPDEGGIDRAALLAHALGTPMFHIPKERPRHDVVKKRILTSRVNYRRAIIIDDEINTGGTIVSSVHALKARGVREVYVAATHGIFSGNAARALNHAPITQIVVTDTIPKPTSSPLKRITTLSLVPLFAKMLHYRTA